MRATARRAEFHNNINTSLFRDTAASMKESGLLAAGYNYVTLGGIGKEAGDRHPKVRRGVLIGAGAKILGNIEIGRCARVAAGSVVLHAVAPNTTVAGVPAKPVGTAGCAEPSRSMDQILAREAVDGFNYVI